MIEVTPNYGPNSGAAVIRVHRQPEPKEESKTEAPKAKTADLPKPIEWSDFLLILMRTLMPFPDARAAVEAYEGASP